MIDHSKFFEFIIWLGYTVFVIGMIAAVGGVLFGIGYGIYKLFSWAIG